MKKLNIKRTINPNTLEVTWTIENPEIAHIAYTIECFNSYQDIFEKEPSVKIALLDTVNNYLEQSLYYLPQDLIPEDFYDKTQEDGRKAVNSLMRELLINSTVNTLPRAVNKEIEEKFKPVTDALMWGWWRTALEKCEEIIPEGYVTQELLYRVHNNIENYVSKNYPKI